MNRLSMSDTVDLEVERLLAQHYLGGSIYFTSPRDPFLFQVARERGLVSGDGQLTALGRLWVTAFPWTVH